MGTVILIRPKFSKTLQPNPPIGLGYLAAFLKKHNHKVILLDCPILNISNEDIFTIIKKYNPSIVGVTALTAHYDEMRELCNFIYDKRKDCNAQLNFLLIIGGIHVTSLPELSLSECKADLAVLGEGELTLLELADARDKNENPYDIDGVAYYEAGNFKCNKPRELIKNLDDLPFPAWESMPIKRYTYGPHGHDYLRAPFAPILTTRGCPFSCTFCASTNLWRRRIRYRSPKNVVDEMEFLIQNYGVREFHIWDDNITLSKKHIIGICREILQRKLDITLKCANGVRIDSLDEELLTWMKRAGFYLIVLAVESGSQRILNRAKKKLDLQKIPRITKLTQKLGFVTKGFFILGLPGENISSALKTVNYPKKMGLNFAVFFGAVPLPGSEIFYQWIREKKISQIRWLDFQLVSAEFSLNNLDIKTVKNLRNRAILTFYLRPHSLYTLLRFPRVTVHWFNNILLYLIRRFIERNIKKIGFISNVEWFFNNPPAV